MTRASKRGSLRAQAALRSRSVQLLPTFLPELLQCDVVRDAQALKVEEFVAQVYMLNSRVGESGVPLSTS
jgi:hypothetical protein